jgi:uncharacterized protein YdeI (YjbR/CyaY-like superfamily)
MEPHDLLFFATAEELRDWLDANHQTADELWLGYYRKSSGRPSVRWEEVVDEVLCVGWVDSVRKGVDDVTSAQRLTPRRKGSTWSARNVANVERLAAEGRMRPAGLAAFEARTDANTAIYAYEQPTSSLSDEELTRFRADEAAWTDWERRSPSYRRQATYWIVSAKQPATRERRLATLIADSHAGRTLKQYTWTRKSG